MTCTRLRSLLLLALAACDSLDKPIGERAPYEPCADKPCGEPCEVCDPNDPDCVETGSLERCDEAEACVPASADLCAPPHEPCAGKDVCEACSLCAMDDANCSDEGERVCDATAQCVVTPPDECVQYQPCAGKVCGDVCTLCPPDGTDCAEDSIYRSCDAQGECVPVMAVCP